MNSLETAKEAWGDNLPDWVEILATEADKTSQAKIAKKIKYSPAVVSLVLKNTYKGHLNNVKENVRTNLMDTKMDCPILGCILIRDCFFNQSQPFSCSGNPARLRLYRACQSCQHNTKNGGK